MAVDWCDAAGDEILAPLLRNERGIRWQTDGTFLLQGDLYWIASGLVRLENGFLKLSPDAAFVSNQVFAEFV